MVFGAQPVARFLVANASKAVSLETDDALEWDARVLGARASELRKAAANGTSVPLAAEGDLVVSSAKKVKRDDASAASAASASACGTDAGSSETVSEEVATALAAMTTCLQQFEASASAAASSSASGAAGVLGVPTDAAAVCASVSVWSVLNSGLFHPEAFAGARAWLATMEATPAFKAALEAEASCIAAASAAKTVSVSFPGVFDELVAGSQSVFSAAIEAAFPGIGSIDPDAAQALVRVPAGGKFKHDLQCDSGMPVFNALRKAGALPEGIRSPRDVGQAIAKALPPNPLVAKTEMAGPGFINVWLTDKLLEDRTEAILREGLRPPTRKPRNVVIDYSSPNIAKDMHVGHLRSTIIGDALSRILEYAGHRVKRVNHVGDWGTQFGMLIAHLKDSFPEYATTAPDISNLTTLYKEAKLRFDDKADPGFKARAYEEVVKLQAGDEVNTRLWRRMVEASAAMFNDVYRRLGVHEGLELCGESFYNPIIPSVIEKLHAQGLLKEEEGALLLFTDIEKVPLMVRKSDGGFCYGSTDCAAIWYRTQELKADWLIYVIDSGQSLHLRLVFEAARLAGWARPGVHRIDHVSFGIVCGEDKKRFRTRSGETVRLVDLLEQAKAMMKKHLVERKEEAESKAAVDGGKALADAITDEAEIEATAEGMGYGAVKYFDLRQNRLSDYVFSYDRMLSSDGDTAVYLQYQFARMHSILRKAAARGLDVDGALASKQVKITHPTEHKLLMQLSTWADAVAEAETTLNPHVLCKWMYETTGAYSEFQRDCRVLDSAEFASRICMVQATIVAVGSAMEVIGIPLVTRI